MTISDYYKECLEEGLSKDEASGRCLGILTSGLIDASDEETYSRLKREFIKKQESEVL